MFKIVLIHIFLWSLILLVSFKIEAFQLDLMPQDEITTLKVNEKIQRKMQRNETHKYSFWGESANCLNLEVIQQGTDVTITLLAPNNTEINFIDRSNTLIGRERMTYVLPESGNYQIVLKTTSFVEVKNGYTIELKPFTVPNERDYKQIKAEKTVSEAEKLRTESKFELRQISIQKFNESIELWKELNDEYEILVANYGLGWVYILQEENELAALSFGRAIKLARKNNETFMLGHSLRSFANAEINLGEMENAIISLEEAISIFSTLDLPRYIGICLATLGNAQYLLEDIQNAEVTFNKSLVYRQKAKNFSGEIVDLVALARLYLFKKNPQLALTTIEKAKERLNDTKEDITKRPEIILQEGWIQIDIGNFDVAEEKFSLARRIYESTGSRSGQAMSLCGLSVANQRKGKYKEALPYIEESVKLVENLLTQINNNKFRLTFSSSVQFYYEVYINLLMKLHEIFPKEGYDKKALEISERARARNLLDLVNQSMNFNPANLPLEKKNKIILLQRKYLNLLKEFNILRSQPNDSREFLTVKQNLQEVSIEKREFELTFKGLKTEAKFEELKPLVGEEIQNLLDDDTLLLEFGLYSNKFGTGSAYLWAVSKEKIIGFTLPSESLLNETVKKTYSILTKRNSFNKNLSEEERQKQLSNSENEYQKTSEQLSEYLLKQLFENKILSNKKKLVIVTNDILQSIPFAALPNPNVKGKYLVNSFEIINLPSASILGALRSRNSKKENIENFATLVLADPVFSQNDERFTKLNKSKVLATNNQKSELRLTDYFGKDELPRLFNTRFEAETISSFLPNNEKRIELDFAANKENIIKLDLEKYQILHFATHALIDDENPELSGIIFSLVDKERKPIEGVLLSSDIYNLKLNADLVVLSGCRTGLGKPFWGEGFVGLTQNFMYAGASRLLTSLWSVDDRATAQLMSYFYKNLLGKKLSYSKALQEAQIEMSQKSRWKSPYYWAGFTLQGEYKEKNYAK